MSLLFYLTSGLFLGWSLGANDASNVFGTAVASRMIRFGTAAFICSLFVILGAVFGGAGAAHGLGKLGAVNAIAGSFTVALSAALTVYSMTKAGLPVSTSQAVVGAIIGWNFFSASLTDWTQLGKIFSTWVVCPLLGAVFASLLYLITAAIIRWAKPHILRQDFYTRWGLILAGAFGSYSLGANNIGNVMGVFVESNPFDTVSLGSWLTFTGTQQLFLLGALAIAVGVFTYSKRVMMTVGSGLMPLSPVAAWVVVVAHSLVLFVFSSTQLQQFLVSLGLPPIPLIPVSSSQAVIGAVIGIALVQRRGKALRQVNWPKIVNVAGGWVATPIGGGLLCYVLLFIVQNVFQETVYRQVDYEISAAGLQRLEQEGVPAEKLQDLSDQRIATAIAFRDEVRQRVQLPKDQESLVMAAAELYPLMIDAERIPTLDAEYLSPKQIESIRQLAGQSFQYRWQLADALAAASKTWEADGKELEEQLGYVFRTFGVED